MAELVSPFAYSKRRGVSPEAVSKAIEQGRITVAGRKGKRVLLDPDVADREWDANTKHQHNPDFSQQGEATAAQAAGRVPNYHMSRAVRENYEARLAKLEFEQRSGKLVNADEVKVAAFNAARAARDALIAIPDRVAPMVAGMSDPKDVHRVLEEEIRRVCEHLSKTT